MTSGHKKSPVTMKRYFRGSAVTIIYVKIYPRAPSGAMGNVLWANREYAWKYTVIYFIEHESLIMGGTSKLPLPPTPHKINIYGVFENISPSTPPPPLTSPSAT